MLDIEVVTTYGAVLGRLNVKFKGKQGTKKRRTFERFNIINLNSFFNYIAKLINAILEKKVIPENWKTALTYTIHTKHICNNYRGITQINVTYKVVFKYLLSRIKPLTEDYFWDYQFRQNRFITDRVANFQIM